MANEPRAPEEILVTDFTAEGVRRLSTNIGVARDQGETKAATVDRLMEEAEPEVRDRLEKLGYNLREQRRLAAD